MCFCFLPLTPTLLLSLLLNHQLYRHVLADKVVSFMRDKANGACHISTLSPALFLNPLYQSIFLHIQVVLVYMTTGPHVS